MTTKFWSTRRLVLVVTACLAVVGLYVIFDLYLASVGKELFSSWLQSEAVEIQEGNLLTSIAKNQRVLLSSRFVKGIVLLDTSTEEPERLIEIGEKTHAVIPPNLSVGKMVSTNVGFLHRQVAFRPNDRPDTLLVFDVHSDFLSSLFLGASAVMILLIVILLGSIYFVEERERRKREAVIKTALDQFITDEEPSEFLEREFPSLLAWWKEKKDEIDAIHQQEIINKSLICLGEVGSRIAHDIRSPLNTINSISEMLTELAPAQQALLKGAIQRIRDIAADVADRNRATIHTLPQTSRASQSNKTEVALLWPIVEEVLSEKQTQNLNSPIKIIFDVDNSARLASAAVNVLELKRTISNLIENAVEALMISGDQVATSIRCSADHIEISIVDNGPGIPAEALRRIGERGFTYGKKNGSGLGVHYAQKAIRDWSGTFSIKSKNGTAISIRLPQAKSDWMKTELKLKSDSVLAILDDDPTIHQLIQNRLSDVQMPNGFSVEHFFNQKEFEGWYRNFRDRKKDFLLLSDQNISSAGPTGIDVIKDAKIAANAVLTTSAYDQHDVIGECRALRLPVLPKPVLPYICISFV